MCMLSVGWLGFKNGFYTKAVVGLVGVNSCCGGEPTFACLYWA